MSAVFEISDRFTDEWADANPLGATAYGISGREDLCTDFSPHGQAARADLYRATKEQVELHAGSADPRDAFGARVLVGWLDERIGEFEAHKWRRDMNHVYSPFQHMRDVFDVMPKSTPGDWEAIGSRLRGFEWMLDGYRASLERGVDARDTVAQRQAESVLEQAEVAASAQSRFLAFPGHASEAGADGDAISVGVERVRKACSQFADWLRTTYLPVTHPEDGVGRDEYLRGADEFLGMHIDPEETYQWGWSEIHRLLVDMEATAREIDPAMTVAEVIHLLNTDPARCAQTREDFVEFVSAVQQQAIAQLAGVHFHVPDELKVVTVNIAPPGGSLGAWYMSPSEDFSRPGSIWYAPGEREALPYWQEVATAYHEGFPGHHLQVGTAVLERENLSRFHRTVIWNSGSGEGWALYAERLMDELGFFEKPEYRLGLLSSQLFRSTRVVIDIGCHLGLRIPDDAPLHPGETWAYDSAVDYMVQVSRQAPDVSASEVKRYLGWWGQAISYKVGEREILRMRDRARANGAFDQKDFHRKMLAAGAIRLDHLDEVMS